MYQRFTASYNIYESCISNLNQTRVEIMQKYNLNVHSF